MSKNSRDSYVIVINEGVANFRGKRERNNRSRFKETICNIHLTFPGRARIFASYFFSSNGSISLARWTTVKLRVKAGKFAGD